jgi:tetratricopeptide (TPR) repeat protein
MLLLKWWHMKIDPECWPALSKLLDEWLDMPEASRPAWLESLGPEHATTLPMLRQIVLIEAELGPEGLLHTSPKIGSFTASGTNSSQSGFALGACVGRYRLVRELGQGGMSVVWLAEPAFAELKRLVALKLPFVSLNSPALAERFARERDILARLTHANIARLYDAGVTDRGQPYLAMEYVEGQRITTYCDERASELEQRLKLFSQVLRAVQYAHTNLIVHRDLKPGNILVTTGGEVRLVDFGIAKLLIEGEANETELTRIGGRALTLDYASPEQITGDTISAASDVYSLGVILYELLTGERPYKIKRSALVRLEDAILLTNPARPSQASISSSAANARSTNPAKLARSLKGDLDTIVLKALQKQPQDRYTTADAFAADIERFLGGEPVLAQPESRWYRAGKFVRRNKLTVGALAAVLAALGIGLGVALWQAHVARVQTQTAKAVQGFLLDIFRANSSEHPDPVKARQTTARELLDVGARQIDAGLNSAPEAKLAVFETLFELYNDMGLKEQGGDYARKRVALAKQIYGPFHPEVASAIVDLALNSGESSLVNERPAFLREAESILDHNRDFKSDTRAQFYFAVAADSLQTDLDKSSDYASKAVNLFRTLPTSDRMASALNLLGMIEVRQEHFPEAIQSLSEAAAIIQARQGATRHSLPAIYAHLADAYFYLLKIPEAEKYQRLALDTARSLKGEEHEDVFQTKYRLGSFYVLTSRPQQGLALLKEALDLALRTKGPDDLFHTSMVRDGYGSALLRYGRPEDGLVLLSDSIDVQRRGKRDHTRDFAGGLERMADGEISLGHYQHAAALLDEASEIHGRIGDDPASRRLDDAMILRARLFAATGHPSDAEAVLKTISVRTPANGQLSFAWLDRSIAEADVALASNRWGAAVDKAREVRLRLEASPMRRYFKRYEAPAALDEGKGLRLTHRSADALPFLRRAVELGADVYDTNRSPLLADAQVTLAECLSELGRRDEALTLLERARSIDATHRELGEHYRQPLLQLTTLLQRQGQK